MTRFASILLIAVCSVASISCKSNDTKKSKWDRSALSATSTSRKAIPVRTTAYTHSESDHLIYGRKNAIGTNLKYYSGVRSAAADWSKYPVGTRFKIVGRPETYEIDDYGSALVGKNTIDIYKPSRAAMNKWGVKHVQIKVLKWGSYRKSMNILKGRMGYKHIRKMVKSLESKVPSRGSA